MLVIPKMAGSGIVQSQIVDHELAMPQKSQYHVVFSEQQISCCVGLVDMVGSTKLAASIGLKKMSKYYQHFLNLMSKIIYEFDGAVIKNIGDCLLFYFPGTTLHSDKTAIKKSMQCALAMIDVHDYLCMQMHSEGLPCIDYRISLDYGQVMPMHTAGSQLDIIGPAVNMCSKINRLAEKNGVVIGGDLYEIGKGFEGFSFRCASGYSVGFKQSYPAFALHKKS